MKFINIGKIKILLNRTLYDIASIYWRLFKPRTLGAGIVIKNGNKVLLIKNTYRSKWHIPGGGNKKRELIIDTALRETNEEVGVVLDKDDLVLLGVFQNNNEGKENLSVIFLAEKNISKNSINPEKGEVSQAEFFDLDDLPNDLSEGVKTGLKVLKSGKYPAFGNFGNYEYQQ